MSKKILLAIFLLFCFGSTQIVFPQYTPPDQQKWNVDPRQTLMYDINTLKPADLPQPTSNEFRYVTAPETERYVVTPNGVLAVSASFRLLPGGTVTQSEVYITRHPLNPLILYASANTYPVTGTISEGTYVSINGGATWGGMDVLGPVNQGGDPGPFIDKNGVFVNTHLGFSTAGMFSNRSVNNGSTWANNVTIIGGSQDKNLATTDDAVASAFYGRSYVVWSRFDLANPPIAIAYTNDGALTWSAAANINTSAAGHYSQGCDTRVGPNGEVYVCWANPISANPFTEDFCGFAKSVDGGVTWTINNNNVFDMNGIRGFLAAFNGIRVNSFPRIDVDRTCGSRRGWIYIVVSQINLAPAGTDADIVLHRSTNGGTTWSAGVRVNQDALSNGKVQYMPCVRVDESGGVNIFYYDNRNTAAPVMQNYLSRSTDGGFTFADVKVTDHNFTPAPIAGLNVGYQGDYIGITSANNKIWCNWMDNSSGVYQSWAASVDYLLENFCEDFSCNDFPPTEMIEEFSGTNYWSRQNPTAYGIGGTGSARFNSWLVASSGISQSLVSLAFNPVAANTYLTFDEAYAPWSGGITNIDSLIIESSVNGGTSYTTLAKLWGGLGPNAGPLNTAPPSGIEFTPLNSQWGPEIYLLPVGTNKIRLRARSGGGNDIWVDNLCVQVLPTAVSNSIGIASEGMWVSNIQPWRLLDTVRVYLHRVDFPNIVVDSAIGVVNPSATLVNLLFNRALTGNYYKVMKHRNTIETWSKAGGELYTRGSNTNFNFLTPAGQAFDNNQQLMSAFPYYAMFSGDVNQDFVVNLTDKTIIYNDFQAFVIGYVPSDVTGDNVTNLNDLIICHNNDQNFVSRHAPPGAEPTPGIITIEDNNMNFENDAQRQKYELTKKLMLEQEIKNQQDKIKKEADLKTINDNKIKGMKKLELLNKYIETHSPPANYNEPRAGER